MEEAGTTTAGLAGTTTSREDKAGEEATREGGSITEEEGVGEETVGEVEAAAREETTTEEEGVGEDTTPPATAGTRGEAFTV